MFLFNFQISPKSSYALHSLVPKVEKMNKLNKLTIDSLLEENIYGHKYGHKCYWFVLLLFHNVYLLYNLQCMDSRRKNLKHF